MREAALNALSGVGDKQEWHEWTGAAFHVRRRLRPDEEAMVGPALNLRGTAEGLARFESIKNQLCREAVELAIEELV